jgi:hypothetical protein
LQNVETDELVRGNRLFENGAAVMSVGYDIDQFVKDPGLLIEFCREVIYEIVENSCEGEMEEKEAQLREISRTIERLERAKVAVPDALRAEKTRLVAAIGDQSDSYPALRALADGFGELVKELKSRLDRSGSQGTSRRSHGPRSNLPKTGREILRENIIEALRKLGGRAQSSDVIEQVGRQLEGRLLPGDKEWRKAANAYAWQHNVHWERFRMIKDGLLHSDSPRGYWELDEDHR